VVKPFKPLLAATVEDATKLTFPLYATPKIDGIRCLLLSGGKFQPNEPKTRALKDIPNRHIRKLLERNLPAGLDGELWIEGATCFGDVSSGVMSGSGEPPFTFYIFDWFTQPGGYLERMGMLNVLHERGLPAWAQVLFPTPVKTLKQLTRYEGGALGRGYEGVMLRIGHGRYKFGRSTLKEGILMKLKRFTDGEAMIIGFEEQLHNENELEQDNLGHAKRSTKKAGMKPAGTLGKLVVLDVKTQREFRIGTGRGLTAQLRDEIWKNQTHYLRWYVKYQHQAHGAKDAARIPIFLGFRSKEDM
jgi:DNA ligase-1